MRGLEAGWEQALRREPGRFPALELEQEASWARREFLRSDLADVRLRARLESTVLLVQDTTTLNYTGQFSLESDARDEPALHPRRAEFRHMSGSPVQVR